MSHFADTLIDGFLHALNHRLRRAQVRMVGIQSESGEPLMAILKDDFVTHRGHFLDAKVEVVLHVELSDSTRFTFPIWTMRSVYPRDVRASIDHLKLLKSITSEHEVLPVAIADQFSSGAREMLRNEGIGYYDSDGNMYLEAGDFFVDIERPSSSKHRKPLSLFSGAREQVVHALLIRTLQECHSQGLTDHCYFSGQELAAIAETSPFTVSQTLRQLEMMELVASAGSGAHQRRRVRSPNRLLDHWAQAWATRNDPEYRYFRYAPPGRLVESVQSALHYSEGYAITGAAAANQSVSVLTGIERVDIIVPPGTAERFARTLDMERVDSGANIVLIERDGAAMLFTNRAEKGGTLEASPFVQYLDLLNGVGRNKELAAEFRKRALNMGDKP